MNCPCNSGLDYENCCQNYHLSRSHPATAEVLMRSRYSAYVLGVMGYLFDTTHPAIRVAGLKAAYQSTFDSIQWLGLNVLSTFQGSEKHKTGKVEFEASYIQDGQMSVHHEISRFKRHSGRWHYLDGEISEKAAG